MSDYTTAFVGSKRMVSLQKLVIVHNRPDTAKIIIPAIYSINKLLGYNESETT